MNGSEPLSPAESARLAEFARACKAAARAVSLYPEAHPTIATTMARLVEITSVDALTAPIRLTITGKSLRLDGKRPVKPEPVITELAVLLNDYAIGELIVHGGAALDDWRRFLQILRRTPDAVRTDGGVARLVTEAAPSHIDVREIDYAQLLRERGGLSPADWEDAIAACLQGRQASFNADLSRKLLEAVEKGALGELLTAINARGDEDGTSPAVQAEGILGLVQVIVEAAGGKEQERADVACQRVSQAFSELSPKVMLALAHARAGHASSAGDGTHESRASLADRILKGMREETIAHFVAQNVAQPDLSTTRLAQAFQALVQDTDQRERLLTLAHDEASASPVGRSETFDELWNRVSDELRTYSDKPFVSEEYSRELTRVQTVPVEQVDDDPPERVRGWLDSVATSELRGLDLVLVNDLLRLEQDEERRMKLMPPTVALVEDLLLVGDLDPVEQLIAAATGPDRTAPSPSASHALTLFASGQTVRHITSLLAGADETQANRLHALCLSLDVGAVGPLVEALSVEDRTRVRERLTRVVDAFGAAGREALERLKTSPDPAIRRTVLHLQREFGDAETLPDAGTLANGGNPQAQREAVRTIVTSGTDRAYRVFEQALAAATPTGRDALMQSVAMLRDDRATGLYAYLVTRLDHRGPLSSTYQRAIQALGASKSGSAIPALETALYRGEWWSPGRTSALRDAAAAALARIGTADALAVLEKASQSAPRGVRSVARSHLKRTGAGR